MPRLTGAALGGGIAMAYLSLIVLIPLAAVVDKSLEDGFETFWNAVTNEQAQAALKLSLIASAVVAAINAVIGTLIAWVLVRDDFRGKGFVNSIIDLPFALPTIVAGLTLLALYGPRQPVLIELDREMEEAAASLGAGNLTIFRRVILPNLMPAILAGVALAFARSVGEFGSLVLITGNLPFDTEVASVFIFGQIESDRAIGAAAVSVVLLAVSLIVLLGISFASRWGSKHDR
jgi:sulfate/thiosulfate transport system permease protein